jgi:hypothetical protein
VAEEPTLGEIGRRLDSLIEEFRGLRAELVRKDVHDAQMSAIREQVQAIKEDRTANRRLVYSAALMALASIGWQAVQAAAGG